MSIVLSQIKLKKRQIRQSVLMLLVFFAAFFAHSQHVAQVNFDALSTFEQHDCHLCQQGIDSPPAPLALKSAKETIFFIADSLYVTTAFVKANYVYPLLRAPPTFL
jgi:hypothetical protein